MEVGQGQNWGCSAKGKKNQYCFLAEKTVMSVAVLTTVNEVEVLEGY
jgi:hypothetical protein